MNENEILWMYADLRDAKIDVGHAKTMELIIEALVKEGYSEKEAHEKALKAADDYEDESRKNAFM